MHFITILKSNNEIIDYRIDSSVPEYWTIDSLKSTVSLSKNIEENLLETFSFETLPQVKEGISIDTLTPHMHSYDVTTNQLENNSMYVEPAIEKRFSIDDVISKLTLQEKTKFINRLTPTAVTAIEEFKTLRNESDTIEILKFLVDSGDISQTSMNKILA